MATYGYSSQTWADNDASKPLSAARMTHIETGLAAAGSFINVRDAQFGAVGDGVTDDSAAIQLALNTLDANRAGTVYFPQGKYLVGTGLTCNTQGATLIGDAHTGMGDDLAKGCTQIIVGNGQWGLTLGNTSSTSIRGYRVENLHFYEQNAGLGLGGIRILRCNNSRFVGVTCGRFTAGKGILSDGTGDNNQYNTFIDCRFGLCNVAYHQKAANGTRFLGGYFESNQLGAGIPTGSIAIKLESGDTFYSAGTVVQGFDTLVEVGTNIGHWFDGLRIEVWKTQAVHVLGTGAGARGCHISAHGDNTLNGSIGTGIVIDAGAVDIDIRGFWLDAVATRITDNGTGTLRTNSGKWL